ncbi:unnamed protein product [Prunus brigantina]
MERLEMNGKMRLQQLRMERLEMKGKMRKIMQNLTLGLLFSPMQVRMLSLLLTPLLVRMLGLLMKLQERYHQMVLTHLSWTHEVMNRIRVMIDKSESTFVIKTMSLEHTCGRVEKLKYASSKWLSNRYSKKLKRDADLDVKSLQEDVLEDYAMLVTRHQIYRAKKRAKVMIQGSYIEQYARLRDYAEELKKANKVSTVVIKTEQVGGQAIFLRMYVCFAGCRQGFLDGCRPVIGVDRCHVKGPYPGQILTAVGVDGNNGSFPIAYAVVEIESKQSWIWFLRVLIEDLKITNGLSYAFISDKQKGLVPAIETLLPTAEHRMCVRHLYNNFISSHSGLALKHLLWAAARATTMPWWEASMENMKQEDEEAWKWLSQRPAKNWSRSHFNTWFKCDLLLNNLCESFNSAIVDARDQSILTCLERIRVLVMLRMANRRAACPKWKHPANASSAQQEVHTEGGAVRVRGRGRGRGIANEAPAAPAVAPAVPMRGRGQSVARGIRGWPRSMLRDMGKGLARGTGRANEAPAVATEVATSSQQSVRIDVSPLSLVGKRCGKRKGRRFGKRKGKRFGKRKGKYTIVTVSCTYKRELKSIFNFCHCPTWFHIRTSSY